MNGLGIPRDKVTCLHQPNIPFGLSVALGASGVRLRRTMTGVKAWKSVSNQRARSGVGTLKVNIVPTSYLRYLPGTYL